MLTTNLIYYKRQLWTYNLGIHECDTNQAFMNMWSEDIASRGASEIASCLLKYIRTLPIETKHVIAYSDTCGGQNRNFIVSMIWLFIVANSHIEIIDYKFLVSGHSYLENDSDFGHIEKMKKKTQFIYVPEDWMQLVEKAGKKFKVIRMQRDDFVSTEPIKQCLVNCKIDTEKQKINWLFMRWLNYRKSDKKKLFFKETLNTEIDFRVIDLNNNKKPEMPSSLPILRTEQNKIKLSKAMDLQSLLAYIPPIYHPFYDSIISNAKSDGQLLKRSRGRPQKIHTFEEKILVESSDESVDLCDTAV